MKGVTFVMSYEWMDGDDRLEITNEDIVHIDAFKEIPAINFYGRSNVESNIQHAVEKDIGDVDAPKRPRTRNVYYAEESDSDKNDPFHCSNEEPKNKVGVAIEIDDLGSGVEDLPVECDAVIDKATATRIDKRPRLREVQEGPLRGKKVPAHLFPPDIEPEVPNESFVDAKGRKHVNLKTSVQLPVDAINTHSDNGFPLETPRPSEIEIRMNSSTVSGSF
ncbi:hypothetical protein FQA39_LY02817 [Lamprigera yunnana]|nr:hypothetical protein FQA39_LY02817 [Lamprigera yunnana]